MTRATLARATTPMQDHSGRTPAQSSRRMVSHTSGIGNQARLHALQAKLRIGAVDDPLEREADAVADSVMRMPDTAVLRRKCAACEEDNAAVQRVASSAGVSSPGAASGLTAPDIVQDVVRSAGAPLDAATGRFMSDRIGHDFGAVRIHTDSRADTSARAVDAHAFTVGDSIVFAAGQYRPGSDTGRRLIAHELAHVVQQAAGGSVVRRQPAPKPPAPKSPAPQSPAPNSPATNSDVAIVLSDDQGDMVAAGAYARTVIRVFSADDAAAKLKALGHPVGTLFVVSHSTRAGEVKFSDSIGVISWVKLSDLGSKLKGSATIDTLDFQGCNLGGAPGQLESARAGVGAQTAAGVNCWTFTQTMSPLTLSGTEITNRSQIPAGQQAAFDSALLQAVAAMKADNGTSVQNCIVGLNPKENAGRQTLAKLWQIYENNKGNMVSSWASPEYNHDWQAGSICTKNLTDKTTPCSRVTTTAPPAPPAQPKAPGPP